MSKKAGWSGVAERAKADAMSALREDMSGDELIAVFRKLGDELHKIPPRQRAVDAISQTAEELVRVLSDAGLEFADQDNAGGLIGTSMLAAWMEADRIGRDAGDWAEIFFCLPDAIEWARWNATEPEEWARDSIRRILDAATEGKP